MSTRAMVDFVDSFDLKEWHGDKPPEASDILQIEGKKIFKVSSRVYRHCDGYPEGLGTDLLRFFNDVESRIKDRRFNDAEYLAAKFVVWQAIKYTRNKTDYTAGGNFMKKYDADPLDFLGLGVSMRYHSDLEYVYRVDCNKTDDKGRPTVTYSEFSGYGGGEEKCGKFKPLPKNAIVLAEKVPVEAD